MIQISLIKQTIFYEVISMDQEQVEKQMMDEILDIQDPCFEILRRQYAASSIESRIFTGHGFFTEFTVPDELVVNRMVAEISDVVGEINDGDDPFGTRLTVTDGRLDTLEAYAVGDEWPSEIKSIVFYAGIVDGESFRRSYRVGNVDK